MNNSVSFPHTSVGLRKKGKRPDIPGVDQSDAVAEPEVARLGDRELNMAELEAHLKQLWNVPGK